MHIDEARDIVVRASRDERTMTWEELRVALRTWAGRHERDEPDENLNIARPAWGEYAAAS